MANLPENNLVSQRVRQFDIQHSKDGPGIYSNGWVNYPDGARRESNPLGALVDAVDNQWEPMKLERAIAYYWELATKHAEDAFNERRESWLRSAKVAKSNRYVQPPPENTDKASAELKQLKIAVQVKRRKLEQARKVLNKGKDEYYWERQEESDKQAKRVDEFIEELSGIKI